jgi:hypothetical protein
MERMEICEDGHSCGLIFARSLAGAWWSAQSRFCLRAGHSRVSKPAALLEFLE